MDYTTTAPVTVTLDQAKELGRKLTMEDALILIECRPRKKAQEVDYIEFEPISVDQCKKEKK